MTVENPPELTRRQAEVLRLVVLGWTTSEIGEVLGLSHHTVKVHVDALRQRFGVKRKRDLIGEAYRYGLVDPNGTPSNKVGGQ